MESGPGAFVLLLFFFRLRSLWCSLLLGPRKYLSCVNESTLTCPLHTWRTCTLTGHGEDLPGIAGQEHAV